MLKYRLIFGPLMLIALVVLFHLDNLLDPVSLSGTWWQTLFFGRTYLPAGLLMLMVFLVLIVLAALELSVIFHAKGIAVGRLMTSMGGVIGCTAMYVVPADLDSQSTMALFASILVILFLAALIKHCWLRQQTQGAVAVAGAVMLAVLYLGVLPGFYLAIRRWHSAWVVAAIIMVTKSCDIGAYFTGRAIGRHKLIPWLSPGKTWEGLVGGVAFSTAVAVTLTALSNHYDLYRLYSRVDGVRYFTPIDLPLWVAALGGAVMALVGQFGDLTASLFKRDAGIKDSGHTVPGFGGLIDVIDSPIVVAPLAYWILRLAEAAAI